MGTLQVPIDSQVLIDPYSGLVKTIEEDQPGIGREIAKLLIEYPESLQDVQQDSRALLHGYLLLLEERVLLLLDEVGELRAGGAKLQFLHAGAVVHADHVVVVDPAEHVGVELVLLVGDVGEHCAVPHVGALVADVEVELALPVEQLQLVLRGSGGAVALAHRNGISRMSIKYEHQNSFMCVKRNGSLTPSAIL